MAKSSIRSRPKAPAPSQTVSVLAFPQRREPAARRQAGTSLETAQGTVRLDLSDPTAPVARADLDEGTVQVGGTALGVEAPFVYSESSDSFAIAFSDKPVVWIEGGRLAGIDHAFAVVGAIQDAIALLVDGNPRILAVARVEMMTRRLVALDAEIAAGFDRSKVAIRADLSASLVAARRALLAEVGSLKELPTAS